MDVNDEEEPLTPTTTTTDTEEEDGTTDERIAALLAGVEDHDKGPENTTRQSLRSITHGYSRFFINALTYNRARHPTMSDTAYAKASASASLHPAGPVAKKTATENDQARRILHRSLRRYHRNIKREGLSVHATDEAYRLIGKALHLVVLLTRASALYGNGSRSHSWFRGDTTPTKTPIIKRGEPTIERFMIDMAEDGVHVPRSNESPTAIADLLRQASRGRTGDGGWGTIKHITWKET